MEASRITERYSLDRQIGHGGSGAVWLGRDEVLGRTVALKRIGFPPGSVDPDVMRAEREARLAARVNHADVVAVFDLLETPEGHWLVMEYVAGTNLATAIDERGPMPPDVAARVLVHVADALSAAHAAGIVHRDVKPSNILLGDDETVKLTDFGIARQVADASLTQTGLVTGSPAYLSPEVASGRSATPASDVWSFGATMYHALAGRPPYEIGDNVMGAMYRIVHEEPPRLRDAGWLAPLLEMTMTRDPDQRPSMAEVRDYLRAPVDVSPTQVLPVAAPPAPADTAPLAPPARPAPEPAPRPAHAARERRSDRKVGLLAAVGGGLVAVLALIGIVLLLGNDDEGPSVADDRARPGASASEGSTAPSSPTEGTTTTTPVQPPTEQELVDYAESYVRTASTDPSAAFQQLTASYQDRSPGYEDFWGSVSGPKILDISADPANMQVTYTYRYQLHEGRGTTTRVERVTLSLVQKGDQILIANATSSPA